MRLGSPFRTEIVFTIFLAVSPGGLDAPPAAARGLDGGMRASFMKIYGAGCMKAGASDPDIAKLPRATLASFCRCSANYIAARATSAQLDAPNAPAMRSIEAQAARACMPR